MRTLIAALLTIPLSAMAHDFDTLQIAKFSRIGDGPYLEILINDTASGERFVCAVYNADGELVASEKGYTDALATKILIHHEAQDEAEATCAFDR